FQRLEDESGRFRLLAQQLPVVPARIAPLAGLLLIDALQINIVNDAAESFLGQHQTRLYLLQLAGREDRLLAYLRFVEREDGERADDVRLAVIVHVAPVGARRGLEHEAVRVEQNCLCRRPEKFLPDIAAGRGEINDGWRHALRRALVADAIVKERDGGGGALLCAWARVGVHPDVAQAVALAHVIAERVAQDRNERYVLIRFLHVACAGVLRHALGGCDAGQFAKDGQQLRAACDGYAFKSEIGLCGRRGGRRHELCIGDGRLRPQCTLSGRQEDEEEGEKYRDRLPRPAPHAQVIHNRCVLPLLLSNPLLLERNDCAFNGQPLM